VVASTVAIATNIIVRMEDASEKRREGADLEINKFGGSN
jgi:hypothetical protein